MKKELFAQCHQISDTYIEPFSLLEGEKGEIENRLNNSSSHDEKKPTNLRNQLHRNVFFFKFVSFFYDFQPIKDVNDTNQADSFLKFDDQSN
ncbi:Oidioi.mRNA.OKI2018_I69.chr1.g2635.t1.cds [Oikopleura dioica]|uniref:Oidioi.mRNA.OKI2018_I69.chr1.g2635.t1.cds n=1 Tax=Oikopleura dioica TaxID=34765 RepID=A0ABN7T0V3_OIKDI|nr:Oidioi.mRNA.OKI2018_I69.chr1.g2635.t1.cds [Oikopleura dioica]